MDEAIDVDSHNEYLDKMTLLCIEDDPFSRILYSSIFDGIVGNLITAENGLEGYQLYKKHNVDIIITDYMMPQMNGLELIRKIRLEDASIPIILATAIDTPDVIIEALQMHVSNFIRKPIDSENVIEAVETAAKIIIAERYMETERNKKIHELQEKEQYTLYQQRLAFDKELAILRNDFYYQLLECPNCRQDENIIMHDFFYSPLDILSGDAYSVRKIDDDRTFYLLVDGMGKGVSASLSAVLMTAHINHTIDKMVQKNAFDLNELVKESIDYIQPILLEDEIVSLDFILINQFEQYMDYAKFAMPPSLLQDMSDKIYKYKSNNPPLNKYQNSFKINRIDISSVTKFLFCTDGLVENMLINGKDTYAMEIENDFLHAFTKEEFKKLFFEKIDSQEDDITIIFINRFTVNDSILFQKHFATSLIALDEAGDWYESLWRDEISHDGPLIANAQIVFTELMMNAYEHGNLGIGPHEKHRLMEEDIYLATLSKHEVQCTKQIHVKVNILHHYQSRYVVTQIIDEGIGFDTKTLSQIFRNRALFNGRGVYVSRQSSSGIYYNRIGNSVIFLHKVPN